MSTEQFDEVYRLLSTRRKLNQEITAIERQDYILIQSDIVVNDKDVIRRFTSEVVALKQIEVNEIEKIVVSMFKNEQ